MKHDSSEFFRELKLLQDKYLVNIVVEESRVTWDFVDDPRLNLEPQIVIEDGKRVIKMVPVYRP